MATKTTTLADAMGESFRPNVLAVLQEVKAGLSTGHTGSICAFHYLLEKVALPGNVKEFASRFACLVNAVRLLNEEGIIRLSDEPLNPSIYLTGK